MMCSICRNDEFKHVKRKYVLKTRFSQEHEIILENLPVHECKICGNVIVPESSQQYITLLRGKIRRDMEPTTTGDTDLSSEMNLVKLKNTLIRFIS